MVQALGHVEEPLAGDAQIVDTGQQGREAERAGLVRAHVLGGDDEVEVDAEARRAAGERGPVDVREDDQAIPGVQPMEGVGGVREGRPLPHRGAEGRGLVVAHRSTQRRPDTTHRLGQDVGVAGGRVLLLHVRLVGGEGGDEVVRLDRQTVRLGPRSQGRRDAGLPVDQRAVAVEAQGVEVREGRHRASSGRVGGQAVGTARAAACSSRSWRFRILPGPDLGRGSVRRRMAFGTL